MEALEMRRWGTRMRERLPFHSLNSLLYDYMCISKLETEKQCLLIQKTRERKHPRIN